MRTVNRFGEPVHVEVFPTRETAQRFTKMLGRNPRCFSLVGMHHASGQYEVIYRARSKSPWQPDPRATWPKQVSA